LSPTQRETQHGNYRERKGNLSDLLHIHMDKINFVNDVRSLFEATKLPAVEKTLSAGVLVAGTGSTLRANAIKIWDKSRPGYSTILMGRQSEQ
jgi:hypothetical protein